MGSGQEPHEELARPLGRWLARRGFHLLTGGGGGVMASVSRAFFEIEDRAGLVIGVLPSSDGADVAPPRGYPNDWVEIPIGTHLSARGEKGETRESRNHINVLSSDVVLVLPGGAGTLSEVRLAQAYGRPVAAFFDDCRLLAGLPDDVVLAPTLDDVGRFLEDHLP